MLPRLLCIVTLACIGCSQVTTVELEFDSDAAPVRGELGTLCELLSLDTAQTVLSGNAATLTLDTRLDSSREAALESVLQRARRLEPSTGLDTVWMVIDEDYQPHITEVGCETGERIALIMTPPRPEVTVYRDRRFDVSNQSCRLDIHVNQQSRALKPTLDTVFTMITRYPDRIDHHFDVHGSQFREKPFLSVVGPYTLSIEYGVETVDAHEDRLDKSIRGTEHHYDRCGDTIARRCSDDVFAGMLFREMCTHLRDYRIGHRWAMKTASTQG